MILTSAAPPSRSAPICITVKPLSTSIPTPFLSASIKTSSRIPAAKGPRSFIAPTIPSPRAPGAVSTAAPAGEPAADQSRRRGTFSPPYGPGAGGFGGMRLPLQPRGMCRPDPGGLSAAGGLCDLPEPAGLLFVKNVAADREICYNGSIPREA